MWLNERVNKENKEVTGHVFSMCCLQGKVILPQVNEPPPFLKSLYFNKETELSKQFHLDIRQYNKMFSFTSMGGKINHAMNNGKGPYTFSLSGMNYHSIGDLLPPVGCQPVFSQLYIHDTDNEVRNRISAVRYVFDFTKSEYTIIRVVTNMMFIF